ncbi:hypothetical protein [Cochleicola gelatinilyticus]|uniref:DUF4476 domain-containing protein n=1 Tax=Cochleicola gelatinilyticus TaxID=1763537 RepID=A0A167J6Z9_9FLAO|nr:hypothetical protein [Cochleicola gelatinilyticus]OAB80387.1 hypothetical protein ULVI_06540 [Cochleicola gelatinilyticus]
MNTLQKTLALIIILLIPSVNLTAQDYKEQLAPIYITMAKDQQVSTNSFTTLHRKLIKIETFKFRNEIKKADLNQSILVFFSDDAFFTIEKAEYLKLIRKAANRSENALEFTNFLKKRLPKIEGYLENDASLLQLFEVAQEHTTHGKFHSFPEFYSI